MSNPTKKMKYSDFVKVAPEERLHQSEYFRKKYPLLVPAVLYTKAADMPELPNCKFLLNREKQLFGQLNMFRLYIQKHSGKAFNESEGLYFSYNRKLLNGNIKVSEFMAKQFRDSNKDGWVHFEYNKQEKF